LLLLTATALPITANKWRIFMPYCASTSNNEESDLRLVSP
jgi:hypothetical protein